MEIFENMMVRFNVNEDVTIKAFSITGGNQIRARNILDCFRHCQDGICDPLVRGGAEEARASEYYPDDMRSFLEWYREEYADIFPPRLPSRTPFRLVRKSVFNNLVEAFAVSEYVALNALSTACGNIERAIEILERDHEVNALYNRPLNTYNRRLNIVNNDAINNRAFDPRNCIN
jgi:hypothetical protein